jgi:catechol 2,3-dioxygenase-like lactoylglutathione lyase family enzyme
MSSSNARPEIMKLEVVVIPVADVERSLGFYRKLGWRLDADFVVGDSFRVVQLTPPGSSCSVHFGKGLTEAVPGSASGLYLVVSDIEATHARLFELGVAVSEVEHRPGPGQSVRKGVHPEHGSYASFATFNDPDGNTWLLQEVTTRLPGRVDPGTTYASIGDLASALRRAEAAHGEHEKRTGVRDENWPDWYSDYMVREQTGQPLPA